MPAGTSTLPPGRGPRPARRAAPGRHRRPTARSRRTTATRRSPPRSRRQAARPAGAGGRASCAGPGPGQGDRAGTGCGQPGQAKMASAGGCPSAGDGECENLHRSARALPATSRHAGHTTCHYDTAGHSLTSRLCRVPGSPPEASMSSLLSAWETERLRPNGGVTCRSPRT